MPCNDYVDKALRDPDLSQPHPFELKESCNAPRIFLIMDLVSSYFRGEGTNNSLEPDRAALYSAVIQLSTYILSLENIEGTTVLIRNLHEMYLLTIGFASRGIIAPAFREQYSSFTRMFLVRPIDLRSLSGFISNYVQVICSSLPYLINADNFQSSIWLAKEYRLLVIPPIVGLPSRVNYSARTKAQS